MTMFNKYRKEQYHLYNKARKHFIKNPNQIIELEKYISQIIWDFINNNIEVIIEDYNEASKLYPFWQEYPPDDRGRKPKGDQYPWIEVGEHTICPKLSRYLSNRFRIKDSGIPTGPDERYVISSKDISKITKGYTNSVWVFVDVKSVGPRDDQEHTVMSHNQISGDGTWKKINAGVRNKVINAKGKRASHDFYCAIPPIYILSDQTILPVIQIVIKPVYKMLDMEEDGTDKGQPLHKIVLITIPNGLLLFHKPGYLKKYPGLFFPGKDDKQKNLKKRRARVSFNILTNIDSWRVQKMEI